MIKRHASIVVARYCHGYLPMTPGTSMPPGIHCVSTLGTLKETPSLMNVYAIVQEQKQIETMYKVNKAKCGVF